MAMSVPGLSSAGQALGLGGDDLGQQVKDETDDERKRRLALQQQRLALGPAGASLGLGGF